MQAKKGDKVRVHYTGSLNDGSVFDSSTGGAPLEFTLGGGEVIPGFEQAVIGMQPGESRKTVIPTAEAYGPRREEYVFEVERSLFPAELKPEVGQELAIRHDDQHSTPVKVVAVAAEKITLDANHPLAGQALTFEISLQEIVSAV